MIMHNNALECIGTFEIEMEAWSLETPQVGF